MKRLMHAYGFLSICIIQLFLSLVQVLAAESYIEVNYDIGNYKLLQVNDTLKITCKNKLNSSPPSWTYHQRLHNDPRVRVSSYGAESSLVINYTQAEDAGEYGCSINHEYNSRTFQFNSTINVIVNEISGVRIEQMTDSIKLVCEVKAYPSPTVVWKIDYDKNELKPEVEKPDPDDEYWMPPDDKVVVDNSEGRWILQPYNDVNNAALIIANVTEDDSGNYYCFTRNDAGEENMNCPVSVTRAAGLRTISTPIIFVAAIIIASIPLMVIYFYIKRKLIARCTI